jgi:hypothetical protein
VILVMYGHYIHAPELSLLDNCRSEILGTVSRTTV